MIKQDRLIKTLLELIQIDSPSGTEKRMAQEVSKRLKALGCKVSFDSYGNVLGKFPGNPPAGGEPMMLNAHLDTVEPGKGIKPAVEGDTIHSNGDTILGADPKAGVAVILEILESLKEDGTKHLPLEIVFTLGEEVGLLGSTNLDYSKIGAKRGVTFDGEGEVRNVTISAPGYNRVDVTILGRAAHAGVEPEKGISAIKVAAEIISKLKLGRIDFETTANIGLIEGGSARNSVPDRVHFKGEIRSRNLKKLEKHSAHFRQVFDKVMAKYPEAGIELILNREFNSYLFDKSHPMIVQVSQVLTQMGIEPNLEHSGGGTDVNIFQGHGIEAVCVGTGDYDLHTKKEHLKIPQFLETARFAQKLVMVEN